jgi:hypothetical protein
MKKIICILITLFVPFILLSTIIIVDENGSGDYLTIQEAIEDDDATNGAEIIVYEGSYDHILIESFYNLTEDLHIHSLFDPDNPTVTTSIENTIISAGENDTAVEIMNCDTGNFKIIIEGFSIKDGHPVDPLINDGHGVFIESANNQSLDVVLNYNYIFNNISEAKGAGISVCFSTCNITNNKIYLNETSDSAGGICMNAASGIISNNLIYSNSADYDSGGIFCIGMSEASSRAAVEINDNEIYNNLSHKGGGIGITANNWQYIIDNNYIHDNEVINRYEPNGEIVLASGGGIRVAGNTVLIDNIITDNISEYWGGGVSCGEFDITPSTILERCIITNNTASKGGGIAHARGQVEFSNCTIVDNSASSSGGGFEFNTDVSLEIYEFINPIIKNCIVYGNTSNDNSLQMNITTDLNEIDEVVLNYSCIEGGRNGISGNTDNLILNNVTGANPQFADSGNGDYHLTDASPCVDTGDPTYPADPDGTTIEMGRYYYPHPDYDIHHLYKGFNWESFPRIGTESNGNNGTYFGDVLDDIYPFNITNINIQADDDDDLEFFYYIYGSPQWLPEEYEAQSSWLYKIEVLPSEERILTVEGERLSETFDLSESGEDPLEEGTYHWLGFWLPRNQKMIESFGTYWSKVDKVKSEDWFYSPANNNERGGDPNYPIALNAENLILQSGKGYMVLFKDLEGVPITDFHWTLTNAAEEPEKKVESENFTYTEKADYEAIDVFNIPPNISEIGVFEDGVCVGAVVVEDTCAQILVYSDNANRSPIPFTLEVVTGRGLSTPINDYQVMDMETGKYETKSIFSGRQEYSVIRFGDEDEPENNTLSAPQLHGNYPNPFNPTTTISFSLPDEQEIELSIYNIKGQKVKQLINGQLTNGQHSMTWNGKDTNDKSVSTGIYFYKLKTENDVLTRKMLMLK